MKTLYDKYPVEIGFPKRKEPRVINNYEELCEIVNKNNGRKNIYTTICAYSDGGTTDYEIPYLKYESIILSKIFFDLDSDNSFNSIQKLHKYLINEDLKHCMIMSGGGFHCYVVCEEYQPKNSKFCLENIQRSIIEKAGLTIGEPSIADIDEHIIGDDARISRVVNTYNLKRKCFCIPIVEDDFKIFKNLKDFQNLALKQRLIPIKWYGKKLINTKNYDNLNSENFKNNKNYDDVDMGEISKDVKIEDNLWHCVYNMLNRKSSKGSNHKSRFWAVLWFREMGYSKNEAKIVCKKYLSKFKRTDGTGNDFKHMIVHDHVFDVVYGKKQHFFPSCEKLRSVGVCPGKCKNYRKMYEGDEKLL